jgi:class 3 adenylate cyclase
MFACIEESRPREAQISEQRWRELLKSSYEILRTELAVFRGRELKTTGDGMMATFDGPARAIKFACSAREKVRELGLQIRTGLHTGECEFQNDRLSGTTVRIAAQILAEAAPGEIWVSGTTKDLVPGSGIEFEDRGLHVLGDIPLGDIPRQWPLFIVKSTDDEAARRSRSFPPSPSQIHRTARPG